MFDTITDTANSMLGISILAIAATCILCHFIKNATFKKVIYCLGFALWLSFWIGFIFFRDAMEFVFNMAVILFVIIMMVCACIWFVRYIVYEMPSLPAKSDPEFRCEHCIYYEDCMRFSECFEPDCPDFEPYEDEEYEEYE